MSCSNPFCTCYLEGLNDGYRLAVKRAYDAGFVDGYVAKSLGHPPPDRLQFNIDAILRPIRLLESESTLKFLPLTVYDVPRPRRKRGCICPDPDVCVCGAW